ncbi:sigma-54 interaction domain-containing protein [Granulicella tundricola]|uniref:sigma-54 interaction domain-containing protein n=1 Tax=Granulicella tundricola TaxID=940615 RepID=UPI001E5B9838|nr:sigma-54 dependent transcriptional regulator [Granulicella tundricola]
MEVRESVVAPFGDLAQPGVALVVVNMGADSQPTEELFQWLKCNALRAAVLGVLPPDGHEALQRAAGAVDDFLLAPVHPEELRQRVLRLIGVAAPECARPEYECARELALRNVEGGDPAFLSVLARLVDFARVGAPVLIGGETGTGKELCARAIHLLSARRNGPFIPVECGSLPDHLFESEIFGHTRGAFTDAHKDQKGLVALAHNGTLFLDEVDSLSLVVQGKLLRLLQESTFRPLGADKFSRADIRIIAASNVSLKQRVEEKRFRSDLFFRLDVLRLHLPALRNRPSDIPLLARKFTDEFCDEYKQHRKRICPASLRLLQSWHWPGNVRELRNTMQRAVLHATGHEVLPCHLGFDSGQDTVEWSGESLLERSCNSLTADFRSSRARAIAAFEADFVQRLLEKHQGNITRAAREAGKERRAFGRLAQKYVSPVSRVGQN